MYSLVPEGEYTVGIGESLRKDYYQKGLRFYSNLGERTVFLRKFWIRTHPVTVREYFEYCVAVGSASMDLKNVLPKDLNKPVISVSQLDAKEFAAWRGGRLPTAYEWEVAARGSEGLVLPWGNKEVEFKPRKSQKLESVGLHPELSSPFGLQELVGYVGEWTSDVWEGKAIVKGCPYNSKEWNLHDEAAYDPLTKHFNVGFRYVLST